MTWNGLPFPFQYYNRVTAPSTVKTVGVKWRYKKTVFNSQKACLLLLFFAWIISAKKNIYFYFPTSRFPVFVFSFCFFYFLLLKVKRGICQYQFNLYYKQENGSSKWLPVNNNLHTHNIVASFSGLL